ncbi:MAG: PHP domain-containing protein [Deltaproteobacteria bacterium]|jgi:predicted metal-dependent phosphoesterase TrpH|nr:PHP domain-containing protein [Deltaproteobacteria bacterium]
MRQYIDLHLHSTASDGSLAPAELMRLAAQAGIGTLALTDHDTTAGVPEAQAEAVRLGLELIPGCELSSKTEYGQVDVLGLWVPWNDQAFEARLEELRLARGRRNVLILDRLRSLGMPLYWPPLPAEDKHVNTEGLNASEDERENPESLKTVGRPHIARQMLQQGYVKSTREAFERYLGEGCPAFAPKEDFSPEQAVRLLSDHGAVTVLAHPMRIPAPADWLEDLAARLKPHGLDALEAYHGEHSPAEVRQVLDLALRHGLLLSGGSDFHGNPAARAGLGRGRGGMRVPLSILPPLKARHTKKMNKDIPLCR